MKYVWITPKWPLPADDGAKQATTQLLRELARAGAEIHLCSVVPNDAPRPDFAQAKRDLGVAQVTIASRPPTTKWTHLRNLITRPFSSLTVAPYDSSEIARTLQAVVDANPDAIVVYDGLHAAAWALGADGRKTPTFARQVYRAHNMERDLWFRAAERKRNPLAAAFLRAQGHRVERIEKSLSEQSLVVFPVSDTDSEHFRKLAPRTPIVTIPIGIEVAPDTHAASAPNALSPSTPPVLFVGKLDWAPNRDGLRWLLEHVWPRVEAQRPELQLVIVGSGDGTWLKPYLNRESIRFMGRVDSVAPYYRECMASIVPVFYGSGTRVKAIESSLQGRACIGTALGVEGIGLEVGISYLQAETEDEWVQALVDLTPQKARELAIAARDCVRERYDSAVVAQRFRQALSDEIKRPLPDSASDPSTSIPSRPALEIARS